MNDKYFEEEIKSIRSGLREYKETRKQFNAKIENIRTHKADKLTNYNTNVPAPSQYNQSPLSRDLSYYKKNPDDSIETATSNCISSLGETTQLSISDRTKACQQLAAKASSKGANHLGYRGASVQEVPAWLATYEWARGPITSSPSNEPEPTSSTKGANLENEELQDWQVTLERNPLNRSQNVSKTETKLKQASTNIDTDIPAWLLTYDRVINKGMV